MVNVVVVSRGLWEMTKRMLGGLIFTSDVEWFLYFFSNGSEDETESEFTRIAPTWKWDRFCGYNWTHRKKPVSLSAAHNFAFKRLPDAEYTMFANNDIVFHKFGWMSLILDRLDQGLDLVGIQEMTWYQFRFVEGSLYVARTSVLKSLQEDGKLFDPRFKLTCEDVDLSRRFLQADLEIGQVHGLQPDYLVHVGHQTMQSLAGKEDLQSKMHASRRALCRKWGVPIQVGD